MIFMALSGQLISRFGYTPVFIGYGIMPVIALCLIIIGLGPLKPHERFLEAGLPGKKT
jgi:hypothetical protein